MGNKHKADPRAARVKYKIALSRPELRKPPDGFGRVAAASPTAAPVKFIKDAATAKLVADALKARGMTR